jgi:hypothetical protein
MVAQAMAVRGVPTVEPTDGDRPTAPRWWKEALIHEDVPAAI